MPGSSTKLPALRTCPVMKNVCAFGDVDDVAVLQHDVRALAELQVLPVDADDLGVAASAPGFLGWAIVSSLLAAERRRSGGRQRLEQVIAPVIVNLARLTDFAADHHALALVLDSISTRTCGFLM